MNINEHYTNGEKLYSKMTSAVCRKYNLTAMEFTVIMFLANNPQYSTASEIVKYRRLTKSHVSVSVNSLQERGLLVCGFSPHDKRSIRLELTEKSSEIINDGRKMQNQFFASLTRGFTKDEIKALRVLTEKIDSNIKQELKSKQ